MKISTDYWRKPATKPIQPGDRFGRLVVTQKVVSPGVWSRWIVTCDCGTEKMVQSSHLFAGNSLSCGCLRDELSSKRNVKHGAVGTAEYSTWRSMKNRCGNSRSKDYPNYGGRGITVCERWSLFENFFADMGVKPEGGSIDRIEVNGNYEPGNCKWATQKEQTENRRSSQHVVFGGERMTVAESARRLGMHRSAIFNRSVAKNETRQQAVDYYAQRMGRFAA